VLAELSAVGIEVPQQSNKVNRIEEIFMRLVVEGRGTCHGGRRLTPERRGRGMDAAVTDTPQINASWGGAWIGSRTIVIRAYGRNLRIWGQTLCRRR